MRLVPLVALLVAVTPAVAQVPDVARTPIDGAAITSDERTADAAAIRAVDAEQWEDALAHALALVQQFGERPAYLARLATIYNRLHRPADEVAQWERFMTVAPRPSQACPALGKAYRGLGQYEEAISAFTRCLASDPESALLVYYLGLGYEWAGDFGQARQTGHILFDAHGPFEHVGTHAGGAPVAVAAFEERGAEGVFQRPQAAGDGGLVHLQAAGGAGQGAFAADHHEKAQVVPVHGRGSGLGVAILQERPAIVCIYAGCRPA